MGRTGSPFEKKSSLLSVEDAVVGFKVTEYHPLCEAVGRSIECEELEREIDKLVYALYGLTPEEIKLVEGTAK